MFIKFICSFALVAPSILLAIKGEILLEKGDYYVVDTGINCSVVEWYGGSLLSEGDELVGDLESYGFKDIFNLTRKNESRVYIEDYLLDEDEAIERVYELGG